MKNISILVIVTAVSLLQTGCLNRSAANNNQPREAQAASIAQPAVAPAAAAPTQSAAAPVAAAAPTQSAAAAPVAAAPAQPVVAPAAVAQSQPAAAPVAVAPAPVSANSYFVNTNEGDPLNVRATSSTQAQVVGRLPQGTQVTMHLSDRSGQWFEVSAPGVRGWVAAAYLIDPQGRRASNSLPAQAPAPVAAPQASASYTLEDAGNRLAASTQSAGRSRREYRVTISSGTLNLRSAPSTRAQVVGALVDGAYVGELEDLGNWIKVVTDNGAVGYAAKQYLYRH